MSHNILDQDCGRRIEASADPAHGYNAATRSDGDLFQMGVIDPAKVTRLALQNAASIAALVLTTDLHDRRRPETGLACRRRAGSRAGRVLTRAR